MNNRYSATVYINHLAQRLNDYYKDAVLSEQYAWWTVETIAKKTRSELLVCQELELSPEQQSRMQKWIHALINEHMPIQYLIGQVPFCDLTIMVKKPTLIPRPETEQWCADIIEQCLRYRWEKPLRILDVCSGTGCIGLACAQALPTAQIVCVDIMHEALELGRLNADHHNLENVTFVYSDLFENLAGMEFDIILSNPPYISQDEFLTLDCSVSEWEDKNALVADGNGYAIIEKIIRQAREYIRPDATLEKLGIPQLVLEHGSTQSAQIVDLMRNAGYIHIETHKDLSAKDRVVSGRLPYVVTAKKTE